MNMNFAERETVQELFKVAFTVTLSSEAGWFMRYLISCRHNPTLILICCMPSKCCYAVR